MNTSQPGHTHSGINRPVRLPDPPRLRWLLVAVMAVSLWLGLERWIRSYSIEQHPLVRDGDETKLIATMATEPIRTAFVSEQNATKIQPEMALSDPSPARIPVSFANVDALPDELDDAQLKAIETLRQKFIQEIGGTGQNPQDATYRTRWDAALSENEELLKGFIGLRAWQELQARVQHFE